LVLFLFILSFFFSSRRRHTRFSRDWSSDVCSSDLLYSTDLVDVNFQDDKPSSLFGKLFGQKKHIFKKVELRRDNQLYYQSEKGRSEERRVGKECRSRWWR